MSEQEEFWSYLPTTLALAGPLALFFAVALIIGHPYPVPGLTIPLVMMIGGILGYFAGRKLSQRWPGPTEPIQKWQWGINVFFLVFLLPIFVGFSVFSVEHRHYLDLIPVVLVSIACGAAGIAKKNPKVAATLAASTFVIAGVCYFSDIGHVTGTFVLLLGVVIFAPPMRLLIKRRSNMTTRSTAQTGT